MSDEPLRPVFAVRDFLKETSLELTILDRSSLIVLASYMDAEDGANGRPSAETIAGILGAKPRSVAKALRHLRDAGLIRPTVDHPHTGRAQSWRLETGLLDGYPVRERVTPQSREGDSPVARGSLPRHPTDKTDKDRARGSNGSAPITEEELREIARERAIAKGGGPGLIRTILRDDRADLEEEAQRRRALAEELEAIARCELCDSSGWIDVDDTTRARCRHQPIEATP